MPSLNFRILHVLRTMRDALGTEAYDYCLGLVDGSEGNIPELPSEEYLEGHCAGVILNDQIQDSHHAEYNNLAEGDPTWLNAS